MLAVGRLAPPQRSLADHLGHLISHTTRAPTPQAIQHASSERTEQKNDLTRTSISASSRARTAAHVNHKGGGGLGVEAAQRQGRGEVGGGVGAQTRLRPLLCRVEAHVHLPQLTQQVVVPVA